MSASASAGGFEGVDVGATEATKALGGGARALISARTWLIMSM